MAVADAQNFFMKVWLFFFLEFFFQSEVRKDVMMLHFCFIKCTFCCTGLHDHVVHLGQAFIKIKFLVLCPYPSHAFMYRLVHI